MHHLVLATGSENNLLYENVFHVIKLNTRDYEDGDAFNHRYNQFVCKINFAYKMKPLSIEIEN